ncbi:DUF2007 domain-containing protein [Desulfosediminicola ganghwensis]|uniref:putative signal transducing protein n=1 Tax=Desulfosediminicola ganghwensis TaxID=2569540 RepID=UPI001594C61B|nr:DUF2007 domain-containing protein [Desulfosediminicola ganghwensis]
MIKIYNPENEFDLIFIKSILMSENVNFYVHNDFFGSLRLGPPIELFNQKTIYVINEDVEKANELIEIYLENSYNNDGYYDEEEKLKVKLSVIIEFLIFRWFVPRRILKKR